MGKIVRAEFNVRGLVQGVGFRYFVYMRAKELGLKGYTKNLYDGTVETVVEGEEEDVKTMHDYLKTGPSHARVQKVQVVHSEPKGEFKSFDVRY